VRQSNGAKICAPHIGLSRRFDQKITLQGARQPAFVIRVTKADSTKKSPREAGFFPAVRMP